MAQMHAFVWLQLVAVATLLLCFASARHSYETYIAFSLPTSQALRTLQQQAQNCTPPRTATDTKRPFCFQPDTVSAEARQFLSQAAAGATPLGGSTSSNGSASGQDQQAAMVQLGRSFYEQLNIPLQAAAIQQYLQTPRNSTIGKVPIVIAAPKGVNETSPGITKVLLYLHGGGYVVGSCQYLLNVPAVAAATAGLTIICPEYRLAPELQQPPLLAGLNDVLTVYKTMINQEGYKPNNIVLLGDSAGGGLVAATAVELQREGVALPAALGMYSPWSDITNKGDTAVTLIGVDPVVPPADPCQQNSLGSAYTAGNASLSKDPLVSPVLADYAALFPGGTLPPTLIQVGLRETLLSDAVRLYHKMCAAAPAPGHVMISPYEGMWHVFQAYGFVPEAVTAGKEMGDYFSRALAGNICK